MAYLWMLIGSIFFAAMSILTESLGSTFSFTWIIAVRSLLATLWMVSLTLLSGKKLVLCRPASLWMRSLAGCSAMLCLFFAMTHYDVAVVLSLSSTFPIWVAILGWPLLGQMPSITTWLALMVSMAGMSLVFLATQSQGQFAHPSHYLPSASIAAAAVAAIFSGIALIGLHKVKQVEPSAVVAHFSAVSTIICLTLWFVLPSDVPVATVALSDWLLLLGVAVTATVGQYFLTKAFQHGQPSKIAVVGLSQIAFAAFYKWLAMGRLPSWLSLVGIVLIVAATLWVMLNNALPKNPSASPLPGTPGKGARG